MLNSCVLHSSHGRRNIKVCKDDTATVFGVYSQNSHVVSKRETLPWQPQFCFLATTTKRLQVFKSWTCESFKFQQDPDTLLCPSINKYWDSCLQESLAKARGKQLIVAGDGRMDSPGYSAKYCTYILHIVSMQIIDKRQTQLKSPTMETKGFKDAIAEMKKKNLDLQEIITDAHPSISAHMRKNEPKMKHSWDVWHGAKNLSKKLAALAVYKANRPLQPWRRDIIKHFWHSCETCGGDEIELRKKWTGVLHHVTGTHEWIFGQYEHGPLEEDLEGEKAYVNPDSDSHKALKESTAELEGFQNHILMYAGKRYQVYKSRCQLAGIDNQKHKDRSLLKAKDGSARYQRSYNKNSMRWTAYPLKEDKQYEYIPELMEDIFKSRIEDTGRITRRVEVMADDPRLLSRTIAPISPPPIKDIFKRQKSRFEQKKDN